MRRLFRFNKGVDENFTGYCQRKAKGGQTDSDRDEAAIFSEAITESMWRALGWACDPKPNAVLTA